MRLEVFRRNYELIMAHNGKAGTSYRLAVNKYADWTTEDRAQLRGYKKTERTKRVAGGRPPVVDEYKLPSSIDWREWGGVTPV